MNWIQVVSIMGSLVLTAAIYGAFPLLFARLRKTEATRKRYRAWCIGITVLVALGFSIFNSLAGYKISFSPALLWGIVFYHTGIKILQNRTLWAETAPSTETLAPPEPDPSAVKTVVHVHKVSARDPSPEQEGLRVSDIENAEQKKKPRLHILPILLSVGLVGACGVAAYQTLQVHELRQQLEQTETELQTRTVAWERAQKTLQDNLMKRQEELSEANVKVNFLDNYIAFVTETGGKYHTYDCQVFQSASSYRAYNIEAARSLGYEPCKQCHPENGHIKLYG